MRGIRIKVGTLIVVISLVLEGCTGSPTPTTTSSSPPSESPTPTTAPPTVTSPSPTPAKFEVSWLSLWPLTVTAGENITVRVTVNNVGGIEGSYAVVLTVDGTTVETKEVTIAAGGSQKVEFTLIKDTPGTYEVGVGQRTASLVVKEKLIELKWDDGKGNLLFSSRSGYGRIVDFLPPATPFIIKQVLIYGSRHPEVSMEGKSFIVAVWDKDMKVIYESTYPAKEFGSAWVKIDIPDVEVNDKFYIHFFAPDGIIMWADNSTLNQHSYLTENVSGTFKIHYKWSYAATGTLEMDASNINWMIRVLGTIGTK